MSVCTQLLLKSPVGSAKSSPSDSQQNSGYAKVRGVSMRQRDQEERPANPSEPPLEILDLEVGEQTGGMYHIKQGARGGYMIIENGIFDDKTMCMPEQLVSQLPPIPNDIWPSIAISRLAGDGKDDRELRMQSSAEALEGVEFLWHDDKVDYFSLRTVRKISSRTREVEYLGRVAIAKIARFPWEIPLVDNETTTYCMISDLQAEAGIDPIIPTVLGHLHENGRVMGLLLEKLPGRCAQPTDLEACTSVLGKLHALGVEHGDVNKHNFIVDDVAGKVFLIDFEHACNVREETQERECDAILAQALADESGRGAGFQDVS